MIECNCVGGDCPKKQTCARYVEQLGILEGIPPKWNFDRGDCSLYMTERRTQNYVAEGKARSE